MTKYRNINKRYLKEENISLSCSAVCKSIGSLFYSQKLLHAHKSKGSHPSKNIGIL